MTDYNSNSIPGTTDPQGGRKDRRRFLGAGAAAAPFLMTMVSQPALGVTCFTPSRSLSRNTSISQQIDECSGAESPGNYAAQQTQNVNPKGKSVGSAYNWPKSVPPSTKMHPLFNEGSRDGVTRFFKSTASGIGSESMTLGEVISINMPGQVHFHIIAAYLNKMGGNGANIPDSVITAQQILNIWADYAANGYFQPIAGVTWHEAEIIDYFIKNGIVK